MRKLGDRAEREFTRLYSKSLLPNLHLDVNPVAFGPPHREMGKICNLARAVANAGSATYPYWSVDRANRPASIVHSDRLTRACAARSAPPSSHIGSRSSVSRQASKSPRMAMTISFRSSFADSRPYPAFQGVRLGHIPAIVPQFAPPPITDDEDDLDLGEEHAESAFPMTPTPVGKSGKRVFVLVLKDQVWGLASNFSETSGLLIALRKAGSSRERIVILTIEAVMKQCESAAGAKSAAKHVTSLLRFSLERQADGKVTLTGETSLVLLLLRDFMERAASRGRTVPPRIRHSLVCWAAALEIHWPLDHALICSAVSVESTTSAKHSPAMPIETAKLFGGVSTNKEVTPPKRAFAAGILLLSYAIQRISDVQRLGTFEVNSDSVHGTLLQCKTKEPHGLDWPWACPRTGMTGTLDWALPLIEFRTAYAKTNGSEPYFAFTRINHPWELDSAEHTPYSITRRKLAMRCVALWNADGESYTLHPPKNLFPAAANQMNFDTRELNIIGHWPISSKMPERYDRIVCATELFLRNTIIQKVADGWAIVQSFHIPESPPNERRIGKTPEETRDTALPPTTHETDVSRA